MRVGTGVFQFYDSPIKRVSEGASQMQYKSPGLSAVSSDSNTFQFYDSPIKSFRKQLECRSFPQFQFYDSQIKRLVFCKNENISFVFQFYDSPIKSIPKPRARSASPCFNSMIVRLKERIDYK